MEQKIEIHLEEAGEISRTSSENKNERGPPRDDSTLTPSGPPPKGVKYRVEYRSLLTGNLVHSVDTKGLDFEPIDTGEIFDIVTSFFTQDEEFQKSKESKEQGARTRPRVTDTRKKTAMHIHSPAIIHAVRSVVKYYPGQPLLGETIVVPEPYSILVHHEKELTEYRERCHPSRQTQPVCPRESNAYYEIKILQDFLEQTIMPAVRLEQERNERGLETFDMLWLRLRPGKTVQIHNDGEPFSYGGVIEYVTGGGGGWAQAWDIGHWTLDFNGKYLGTCKRMVQIDRFAGEREIFDSHVMEDSAFDEPVDESVKPLVEQGERFFQLLAKKCQYYKGTTFNFPYIQVSLAYFSSVSFSYLAPHPTQIRLLFQLQIDGLVMVDMEKYYSEIDHDKSEESTKPEVSLLRPEKSWVTDCSCFLCRFRKEERSKTEREPGVFEDYHGIYPEERASLTPHQLFLLPPNIWAFVFKTRTWEQLHVKSFVDPTFQQNLIDNLVMDPARIRTLKALASSYIRENKHGVKSTQPLWSADFIQGKGRGQIILLHGPPGVGKTCTAECIAEYTKRPLMILTSSDIGANPEKIEKTLSDGFKTASSWNCLVAGFLRALEFYDGILFLTTNRIGVFDDAFMSRIHVKLYYRPFTPEERQRVWQTFIDKLMKDRGSSIRVSIDAKDFIKGRRMKGLKWNGRDIRNAFQTAVALAEYDAETDEEGKILLKDTHLSSIVDMSIDFEKYLDETHDGADENKRASLKRIRLMISVKATRLDT
ncbi:hypothetical protein BDZ45DRAFT_812136 [Acephala macrosclerotiorum]|nr:hypothetical protein BDZ45DRAFT_812136 [Acephala macrosclerotiorum]